MDKNLDKKLNMKVRIKKIIKKVLVAAIKSRISVSFKNPDNIIFVFSKDIMAIYKDNNHLVKDKNYLNGLITNINFGKRVKTANIAINIANPVNKPK